MKLSDMRKNHHLYTSALEVMPNFVIVDSEGIIVYMNKVYSQLLGKPLDEIIGSHVTNIIPGTRLMHILESGKAEIGDVMRLYDHSKGKNVDLVCNRMPIIENGKTIGVVAVTTFENTSDIHDLHKELIKIKRENESYRQVLSELHADDPFSGVIGTSSGITEIKHTILDFAKSDLTFLLTGETGVGKEVFARAIHELSSRADKPYIRINCAAIPEQLLESELFGYEAGAFTGASKSGKQGRFELADGGTLLLDEIGEMPVALQSKLLRVLQDGEVERLGGKEPKKIDVRLICSTNINIYKMVKEGKFRKDLYYRINTVEIQIPPLRQRLEDLPALCHFFIQRMNIRNNIRTQGIDDDVLELFRNYSWPGNVRELEHTIERLAFQCKDDMIDLSHCGFLEKKIAAYDQMAYAEPPETAAILSPASSTGLHELKKRHEQAEKETILNALEEADGNRSKAAKLLGMSRSMFYNKLNKYNIQKKF